MSKELYRKKMNEKNPYQVTNSFDPEHHNLASQHSIVNESHTFCVVKPRSGHAIKYEGKTPEEFIPYIKNVDIAWINFEVENLQRDGPGVAARLGFSPMLEADLASEDFSAYDDLENELGLLFPAVYVKHFDVHVKKLIILIKDNMILTMHDSNITRFVKLSRYAGTIFKKIHKNIKTQDKISQLLIRIIDENSERNFDGLRKIQEQGEIVSRFLIEPTPQKKELGKSIYKMKTALLTYLESLWATLEVIQYLRYGDPDQLTDDPKILQQIGLLGSDLTMQISISEQMSTVLASGLEVLQSIYNNQLQILNNRMSYIVAWLTILGTAVLVPNTIATIFGVPPIAEQLSWQVMTWIIILSTVIAVLGSWWFIKSKKIMPHSLE